MVLLKLTFDPNKVLPKARSKMELKQFLGTLIEETYYCRHFLEKRRKEGSIAHYTYPTQKYLVFKSMESRSLFI